MQSFIAKILLLLVRWFMLSMNKIVFYTAAINMALLLASCSSHSDAHYVSADKVAEARKYIQDQAVNNHGSGKSVMLRVFGKGDSYIKAIDITPDKIKIITEKNIGADGNVFAFPLKEITPESACEDIGNTCLVSIIRYGNLNRGNYTSYEFYLPKNAVKDAARTGHNLSYALSMLQNAALQPRSSSEEFKQVADKYKDASPKPTVPEAAKQLKMQADKSYKDKKYDNATDLYMQAIELATWWPEAHYSLATNLADSKYYNGAVDEMKCYLMLVPDDDSAKDAKDKLSDWEQKIGKSKWYEF